MTLPSLLELDTEADYLAYYEREYCRSNVVAFDGIRVYFKRDKFRHAFYESSNRDGHKDQFSSIRAQRMGWIKATLTNPDALLFMGWDKAKKRYDSSHRVCVLYEDFVVVIKLSLKRSGDLKGDFVTCYQADNSIDKIKQSPEWNREKCLTVLAQKKGR